ncbi:MAG: shikimate dehydrogenase [Dehalococcoidia bacterium]|nr:shikimate dehydrogenase [Dehalococcoidia bacterium]
MSVLVGLIGYPVKHSISASFQQAAFDHLGMDARYVLWEVPPQDLAEKLLDLREPDHLGANVTIPHKADVIPLLDHVDAMARRIGAVNTIVNQGGLLVGFNTDAQGFLAALHREGEFDPKSRKAVLLGAGGAARAVSFGLLEQAVGSLSIINRDPARAQALVRDLERGTNHRERDTRREKRPRVTVYPWEPEALKAALDGCDLVVNCTPLGTLGGRWERRSPLPASLIPPGALVYDLVYNPPETPLLAEARKAGARTLNGLPMLVYQGAASFKLWTGREAPVEVMTKASRRAVGLDG